MGINGKQRWVVTASALQQLRDIANAQMQNAHAMGTLAIEHALAERRLITMAQEEGKRAAALEELGVVHHQFVVAREQFMEAVLRGTDRQARVGSDAISELGLPVDTENFTIRLEDGVVLKLVAGLSAPLEEF